MANSRLCSIPDCDKPSRQRGWCSTHYWRWWKHGDPLWSNPPTTTCTIPGCGKPHRSLGLCMAHYYRQKRNGNPLSGRATPGEPERFLRDSVLTYNGENCLIWPYWRSSDGYGRININRKSKIVSNVVCAKVHGPAPTKFYEAAHSCGNGHLGCVNPHHLSWKTRADNHADKLIHGTHNRGERHKQVKLKEADVRFIRSMRGKIERVVLAERFGITASTIGQIQRRSIWAWLADGG